MIERKAGQWAVVSDCRNLFPPLTENLHFFQVGGDGQEALPGAALPCPLEVGVTNGQWPVSGARVEFKFNREGRIQKINYHVGDTVKRGATVMEHQQTNGITRRRPLLEGQGAHAYILLAQLAKTSASQDCTAVDTAGRSAFRLWSPCTSTTVRCPPAGGIPNGSRVPCTTRVGTATASSSESRLGAAGLPVRRGGCSGKARHTTATASVVAAVRHATRAPEDRPPTSSGKPVSSRSRSRDTTAIQAASS